MKKKVDKDGFNVSAVYWTDATFHLEPEGEREGTDTAVTMGVITNITSEQVTIVGEVFAHSGYRQVTNIPKVLVKKIITLKGVAPSIKKVFGLK